MIANKRDKKQKNNRIKLKAKWMNGSVLKLINLQVNHSVKDSLVFWKREKNYQHGKQGLKFYNWLMIIK